MADQEAPKLIIDSDWKAQAQAEKERLSSSPEPEASGGEKGKRGDGKPPDPSFLDIVRLLTTQALLYMGAFPDPESGRSVVVLDLARYHIELLSILEKKTTGNLSPEESQALSRTVHELRLEFVDVAKAVERAVQEGRATRGVAGGPAEAGLIQ